jgi:tryptophan halogenase
VQVPYATPDAPIASQTTSTAQSNGWIWDIGLPTRRGIGHVYSSAHISATRRPSAELRAYIAADGRPGRHPPAPRKLAFEPGYRARFWHRNCVAIGLSAGFIEPLEASALALVELSVAWLADDMPATRAQMDRWRALQRSLHLPLGARDRLPQAALRAVEAQRHRLLARAPRGRPRFPARLRELLAAVAHARALARDFYRIEEVFPSASYQYILYGMGFRSEAAGTRFRPAQDAELHFREAARLASRMGHCCPRTANCWTIMQQHDLPRR